MFIRTQRKSTESLVVCMLRPGCAGPAIEVARRSGGRAPLSSLVRSIWMALLLVDFSQDFVYYFFDTVFRPFNPPFACCPLLSLPFYSLPFTFFPYPFFPAFPAQQGVNPYTFKPDRKGCMYSTCATYPTVTPKKKKKTLPPSRCDFPALTSPMADGLARALCRHRGTATRRVEPPAKRSCLGRLSFESGRAAASRP